MAEKEKIGHDGAGDINPYRKREYEYLKDGYTEVKDSQPFGKKTRRYVPQEYIDESIKNGGIDNYLNVAKNTGIKMPGWREGLSRYDTLEISDYLNSDGSLDEERVKEFRDRMNSYFRDSDSYIALREFWDDLQEYQRNYDIYLENKKYDEWEKDFQARKNAYESNTGEPKRAKPQGGTEVEVDQSPANRTVDWLNRMINAKNPR